MIGTIPIAASWRTRAGRRWRQGPIDPLRQPERVAPLTTITIIFVGSKARHGNYREPTQMMVLVVEESMVLEANLEACRWRAALTTGLFLRSTSLCGSHSASVHYNKLTLASLSNRLRRG